MASQIWNFLKPKSCIHTVHTKRQQLLSIRIDRFKNASQYLGKAKTLFDEINAMSPTAMNEQDLVHALLNGLREVRGNPYHRMIERMDERFRDGEVNVYTFAGLRGELLSKERFVRGYRLARSSHGDSGAA